MVFVNLFFITLLCSGPQSEISGSLKNLKPEKQASEQNLISIFTSQFLSSWLMRRWTYHPSLCLQQKISVTKIELDKETLITGRSKLFKGCCAIEEEYYINLNNLMQLQLKLHSGYGFGAECHENYADKGGEQPP